MAEQNCIIVGASHAGVSLALQLRREGWSGGIQLLSAEREMPYHRPPLSKEHLAGERELEGMRLRPAKVFEDNAIQLSLGKTALAVNRVEKTVQLDDGDKLNYDKLALCTGALVRTLPMAAHQSNVYYLRNAADLEALRSQVAPGRRAVIIGAGYIGLETASVLARAGLEVTVLEMAPRILQRVTGEIMSDYIQSLHAKHGVTIKTSVDLRMFKGENTVEAVIANDGTRFPADFLIVGIGVVPNTTLAEAAGLQVENGIVVDEFTRTSDPDIHAAGDCSYHPSMLYERSIRLESVQNANDQARIAAANICGKALAYDAVPWFWSDQYDVKLQMAGLHSGHDQVICRGDPKQAGDSGFALFYLQESRLIAADCVNCPKEFMASKKLVQEKVRVDPRRLADESVDPADFTA